MQVGHSLLYSHLAVSMRNIYVSNINKDSVICRRARLVLPCCQERARAVSEFFRRRKVGQKGIGYWLQTVGGECILKIATLFVSLRKAAAEAKLTVRSPQTDS